MDYNPADVFSVDEAFQASVKEFASGPREDRETLALVLSVVATIFHKHNNRDCSGHRMKSGVCVWEAALRAAVRPLEEYFDVAVHFYYQNKTVVMQRNFPWCQEVPPAGVAGKWLESIVQAGFWKCSNGVGEDGKWWESAVEEE